jgi:hypothetical protein
MLIGTAVVIVNAFFLFGLYGPGERIWHAPPGPFPILFVPIFGFLGSVFVLWRMWRLTRGPR